MSESEAFCVGVGADFFVVDEDLAGADIAEPDEELADAGAGAAFAAGAGLAAGAGAAAGFDMVEELAAGAAIVLLFEEDAVESLFFFLDDFVEPVVDDPVDDPLELPVDDPADDPPLAALPEADEPDMAEPLAAVPDFFDLFFLVVVEDVAVLELLELWSLVEVLWDQLIVAHNATNINSNTPKAGREIFLFKEILLIEIISRSYVRQNLLRGLRAAQGTSPGKAQSGETALELRYGQP
jgi:hypothetical protein